MTDGLWAAAVVLILGTLLYVTPALRLIQTRLLEVLRATSRWQEATTDELKQTRILKAAAQFLLASASLAVLLAIIIAFIYAPIAASVIQETDHYLIHLTWQSILLMVMPGAYRRHRARPVDKPKYSPFEQAFQRFILGSPIIQQMSFELEKLFARSWVHRYQSQPVFVLGLARSGTTAMLNLLYATQQFESVTYRDVPFVLMPQLWQRLSRGSQQHMVAIERAHGDQISVDYDSPESFETIFWQTMTDSTWKSQTQLSPLAIDRATCLDFRIYTNLVARKHGQARRYLSKNNNNLLHLELLAVQLPEAHFLVMWRDPLQTAYSLHKQHQRFISSQTEDPFVLEYMDLLGHFEFGLHHKPLRWETPFQSDYPTADPNYWLAYWIHLYEHLAHSAPQANVHLISYEKVCDPDSASLAKIFEACQIAGDPELFQSLLRPSVATGLPTFDETLVQAARCIQCDLTKRSL